MLCHGSLSVIRSWLLFHGSVCLKAFGLFLFFGLVWSFCCFGLVFGLFVVFLYFFFFTPPLQTRGLGRKLFHRLFPVSGTFTRSRRPPAHTGARGPGPGGRKRRGPRVLAYLLHSPRACGVVRPRAVGTSEGGRANHRGAGGARPAGRR